jgi:CubicO group peptidase (beta-lactamase class C family)
MSAIVSRGLVVTIAALLSPGQAPPRTSAPEVSPQVSRAIDSLFARWNTTSLPGCTIGVSRDGRQVVSRAYGMADLEHGIANQPDSIIEAGSVSKQFTAAAVLLLSLDRKLSLDDPVRKYIPEVPDYGVPMTIRHLITHTSGLRDWGTIATIGGWPRTSRAYTHAHVLDIVSRQKALNFKPGTEFSYSNSGYNLAAVLVSRVTGKTFADYTREAIFEPLGMTRTSWRDDFTRVVRDRSIAYTVADSGVTMNMPFENVHGNGGLLTTVGDMLRWNENASSGKVGGRAFVDLQRTRGHLTSGEEIVYSAGLYIGQWKGMPEINHSGGTAGYRAWLAQYPTQRALSVAVLCNASDAPAWIIGRQVADLFLEAAPAPSDAPFTPTPAALSELAGLYRDVKTHVVTEIELNGGQLRGAGGALAAVSRDTFRVGSGAIRLTVDRSPAGAITGVQVNALGEISRFERVEPARPTPADLQAYAGEYVSDEAEVILRVVVHGGQLEIQRRPGVKIPLVPNHADGFSGTIGQVRFVRNPQGAVTEMSISNDRVWDLRLPRTAMNR